MRRSFEGGAQSGAAFKRVNTVYVGGLIYGEGGCYWGRGFYSGGGAYNRRFAVYRVGGKASLRH